MSENITGGILSVETESMTFSPFGVKVRCAGALSNPRIKRRVFFTVLCMRDFNNAGMKESTNIQHPATADSIY